MQMRKPYHQCHNPRPCQRFSVVDWQANCEWKAKSNYELGNTELAINQFAIAHKHNPYNVHAINGMGIAYAHIGNKEKANECFTEAIRICPDLKETKSNLEKINK